MPLNYFECFGETLKSPLLPRAFLAKECRFIGGPCTKTFSSGVQSGACTLVNPRDGNPVICCPKRLYANGHAILGDVAKLAFGPDAKFLRTGDALPSKGEFVLAFGQKYGHEIRVPFHGAAGASKFSLDWILALVGEDRQLKEFIALEVQTIDTTGNYQAQFRELAMKHDPAWVNESAPPRHKSSNFNFENVNKRILPQLITKGHVLRRENLCRKGLYFVCPTAVFDRILTRVGTLPGYPPQTGSITFLGYGLVMGPDNRAELVAERQLTTTTDQLSLAFSSPRSLPDAGVYESAIKDALRQRLGA